jgi:CDP-paratose 2-epimerase
LKILITGGAGFIGCNAVLNFMRLGHDVIVIDNLSRKGTKSNLDWLKENGQFEFIKGDLRDYSALKNIFQKHKDLDVVLHLAGQVAVTTSVISPREDFEINALGTLNILEAIRETYSTGGKKGNCVVSEDSPKLIYSSTNKVYGNLHGTEVTERNDHYVYKDLPCGVSELTALDFHSPYGCSKGAADQYVIDYSRIYGLKTITFRQSCIYGYRQFGVEDQGWVAWFTIAAVLQKPITIYGDGKQVRDVLFIDDLIEAYSKAINFSDNAISKAYNIGGGVENQLSLLDLIAFLEKHLGKNLDYSFSDWRPGDQRVFICDISRAKKELDWHPKVNPETGIEKLCDWVKENQGLFR